MKESKNLVLIALIFFIVSCSGKNESKEVSSNVIQTQTQKDKKNVFKKQQSDILNVSEKMQNHEKLINADYDCICDFLFNNNDEAKSEEIGYQIFEYLKNNSSNNSAFMSYLNEKENTFKEKVLKALIQIMCIDIGEENYSYNIFVNDFPLFKNSVSARTTFNECMSNQ